MLHNATPCVLYMDTAAVSGPSYYSYGVLSLLSSQALSHGSTGTKNSA